MPHLAPERAPSQARLPLCLEHDIEEGKIIIKERKDEDKKEEIEEDLPEPVK